MSEFNAALVMVALFALRCIVPFALTLGLGYAMNRLVDRWEAEDAKRAIAIPATPEQTTEAPQPALAWLNLPCWVTNTCPEKKRADCAAFRNAGLPCWEARRQMEGALPAACPDCPRYQAAFAIAT
ncbi:MAG: hypothetical protein RRC07_04495 [Anaerolineae bacterium]|nr:hypothetical protein [Anaerolineae bacterium]